MRVKVQNKIQFPYDNTLRGLKDLVKKIEESNIPDDAYVYFRGTRTIEIMWRASDDSDL